MNLHPRCRHCVALFASSSVLQMLKTALAPKRYTLKKVTSSLTCVSLCSHFYRVVVGPKCEKQGVDFTRYGKKPKFHYNTQRQKAVACILGLGANLLETDRLFFLFVLVCYPQ
jgi:hypothetical protein